MSDINRKMAEGLWNALKITVDSIVEKIQVHPQSVFLGFVDVTIDATAVLPGFKFKVRGMGIKILKEQPFLEMPTEKGDDGKRYPRYFPLTGELREVMTIAIFKNEKVDDLMSRGAAAKEAEEAGVPDCGTEAEMAAPEMKDDNPFIS